MAPRTPRKPVLTAEDGDGHVTIVGPDIDLEAAGLDPVVGGLVEAIATSPHPVLDTGEHESFVHVDLDLTRARLEGTPQAITLHNVPADGRITASQAHFLAVDLNVAADTLKGLRADRGYDQ